MEITKLRLTPCGLHMIHNHKFDKLYISEDGYTKPLPENRYWIAAGRHKKRLISGAALCRIVEEHNEELELVFYDDTLSEDFKAKKIKDIVLEWYFLIEKELAFDKKFTEADTQEKRIWRALDKWLHPKRDDPAIHDTVDRLMHDVALPRMAYAIIKPEDVIVSLINDTNYKKAAVRQFIKLPHVNRVFRWFHKQAMIEVWGVGVDWIPPTDMSTRVRLGTELLWHELGKVLDTFIESLILAHANQRPDRFNQLKWYIQASENEEAKNDPEWQKLSLMLINKPSIAHTYRNTMGKGSWHKRAHKRKLLPEVSLKDYSNPMYPRSWIWNDKGEKFTVKPEKIAGKCKPIDELLIKDDEEAALRHAVRGESKAYDPHYATLKLSDLRTKLWLMIAYQRQGCCPSDIKKAVGFETVDEIKAEFKKVWDSKKPSFINWLFFHKVPGTNMSQIVWRMNRLWLDRKCGFLQKLFQLDPFLEKHLYICPECKHMFIPPSDKNEVDRIKCYSCGKSQEVAAYHRHWNREWSGGGFLDIVINRMAYSTGLDMKMFMAMHTPQATRKAHRRYDTNEMPTEGMKSFNPSFKADYYRTGGTYSAADGAFQVEMEEMIDGFKKLKGEDTVSKTDTLNKK